MKIFSSVRWERDGNPVEWDSGNEGALRIPKVDASHAGSYTCTVTGPNREIARRELQLIVSSEYHLLIILNYFILIYHSKKYSLFINNNTIICQV